MGKAIEQIALQRGHRIVSIIDAHNPEEFDSEAFRSADVAIEFTTPATAYQNYLNAFAAGVKVVSGTTGWREAHGTDIETLCREHGKTLFWSSNFSLGVALFQATSRYLARLMNGFDLYDVSMSETHHVHKLDAPSGTAVTLAEGILSELDRKNRWVSSEGPVTPSDLPITSIREGEVFGIHTIRYESAADSIVLTHDAKNRNGFALGAVLAAEYTASHTGLLGMQHLFPLLNE